MKTKNVVPWFEIYVNDIERAKTFYETVLELKMEVMPMSEDGGVMVAFPWTDDAPNAAGALVKNNMSKPSSTGTVVYFDCDNCENALNKVEKAGGKIIMPKTSAGEFGFFCLFSDTEGNTVGFFSQE